MQDIPASLWAAAPKDAWWWMQAASYPDPINWLDVDDTPCPGHGYIVDDSGDMEYCNGSCLDRKENN